MTSSAEVIIFVGACEGCKRILWSYKVDFGLIYATGNPLTVLTPCTAAKIQKLWDLKIVTKPCFLI